MLGYNYLRQDEVKGLKGMAFGRAIQNGKSNTQAGRIADETAFHANTTYYDYEPWEVMEKLADYFCLFPDDIEDFPSPPLGLI